MHVYFLLIFRIRTVAGSAKNNSDYIPIDKVVTFLAGERRFKFNVSFVNDLIVENDEDFHLELTSTDPRVNVICKRINYVIQNDDSKYSFLEKETATVNEKYARWADIHLRKELRILAYNQNQMKNKVFVF